MDRKALVGLLSGVSLVVATLIGVAVLNMPAVGAPTAKADTRACAPARKSSDQAYGVGRLDGTCAAR